MKVCLSLVSCPFACLAALLPEGISAEDPRLARRPGLEFSVAQYRPDLMVPITLLLPL